MPSKMPKKFDVIGLGAKLLILDKCLRRLDIEPNDPAVSPLRNKLIKQHISGFPVLGKKLVGRASRWDGTPEAVEVYIYVRKIVKEGGTITGGLASYQLLRDQEAKQGGRSYSTISPQSFNSAYHNVIKKHPAVQQIIQTENVLPEIHNLVESGLKSLKAKL